jgi:hypothetical protein
VLAIDDPIFAAHRRVGNFSMPGYEIFPLYASDNPITVIGCIDQYRFCNPRTSKCTPFIAALDTDHGSLEVTKAEDDILTLLHIHVLQQNIFLQAIPSGASVLAANDLLYAGSAHSLAREQWKVEVAHLFDLGLAGTQVAIVKMAKDSYPHDRGPLKNILEDKYKHTCRIIMFHDDSYTNISVFGLTLIVVSSVVITTLSYCDSIVGSFMWRYWPRRVLAWKVDSALWLLRMCYEQRGVGRWKKGAKKNIPVTDVKGEVLGVVEVREGIVGVDGKEGDVDPIAWGKHVGLGRGYGPKKSDCP